MILAALLACSIVTVQDQAFIETLPESAVKFEMVPVPGGTVVIGDETVTVKPFYMATTETVWEVFDQFLLSGEPSRPYDQTEFAPDAIARPSRSYILPDKGWGHQGYPVINVSSTSVMMFCRWLSSVTGKKYRVPTEAEWELACRAGEASEESAWHEGNSDEVTHQVGKKLPNKLGLYDMFGSVGEWATDLAGKPVLCGGIFTDSLADMSASKRRYWSREWQAHDPQLPKSRWWLSNGYFVGFRLVREI